MMATPNANAGPIISGAVGGAPTGVLLDNLDWLPGGSSPTGIVVNFTGAAGAVTGSSSGLYAAPWISGSNGVGFGNALGADTTPYITSGSTGSMAEILLPSAMKYFGLLWGSVDGYNTLSFYNGGSLLFSFTGNDLLAGANGDQGVNGTLYANITTDGTAFNRIVATSSSYTFEFDNLAFNREVPTVPDAGSTFAAARHRPRRA